MNRLAKFIRLPAPDRSLLLRSVVVLGAARMALWVLPLRTARRLLARVARPSRAACMPAERIGWAIGVARRFVPYATCLPQALAGEVLLTRGGHHAELRIGVHKSAAGRLEAHAWVESGGRIVVGELHRQMSRYTPLPPLPGPRS